MNKDLNISKNKITNLILKPNRVTYSDEPLPCGYLLKLNQNMLPKDNTSERLSALEMGFKILNPIGIFENSSYRSLFFQNKTTGKQ